MHISNALVLLFFLASPVAASQEGYAHGPDHCYHFMAPAGWVMDNRVLASEGIPMVFYPEGSSWANANMAIYTRPASEVRQAPDPVGAQVKDVLSMYLPDSPNIKASKLETIRAKSGAEGELWSFSGYREGGAELVAYFVGPKTLNYFVAQLAKGADVEQGRRILLELASTYREADDCVPCTAGASCETRN